MLAIGLILIPISANAAVEKLNLPTCSLAVYPFSATSPAIYGNQETPYINYLSESTCKSRTPYGASYNQPPKKSENPLLSGANGKNIPKVDHLHAYINSSLQDDYYYQSLIDKFEIKLQSDALKNINLNSVKCITPAPNSYKGNANDLLDCNGTAKGLYGGTKISFNKTTGIITWKFGTNNSTQRPQRWGNNKGLNSIISQITGSNVNLTNFNSLYRKFDPEITFFTKNNNKTIWSATTTSRILIRNYAILKNSVNSSGPNYGNFNKYCSKLGDYTKWCPVPTPAGHNYATEKLGSFGQQEWFWFPIGSVVSVWEKPAAPPTMCVNLTISPNNIKANTPINFTVTPHFTPTNKSIPLNYKWTATEALNNWAINAMKNFIIQDNTNLYNISPITTSIVKKSNFNLIPVNFGATDIFRAPTPSELKKNITPDNTKVINNLPDFIKYGGFKDNPTIKVTPQNPFLEKTDNKTWYSGGPGGTLITVQGQSKNGKTFPTCKATVLIPSAQSLCQLLTVTFLNQTTKKPTTNLIAGNSYIIKINQTNSKRSDGTPIQRYKLNVTNAKGVGKVNPASTNATNCSAIGATYNPSTSTFTVKSTPVSCEYIYTPNSGDHITLIADPSDNVATCQINKIIPPAPLKICSTLVPTINTQDFTSLNQFKSGNGYDFGINAASSKYTDGSSLDKYSLDLIGKGILTQKSSNASTCPNPVKSQQSINLFHYQVTDAPSKCIYHYTNANSGDEISFKTSAPINSKSQCSADFKIPPKTQPEICANINLNVNGQLNNNPTLKPGTNYNLQVNPLTNKGNPINMVTWTENGNGKLVGNPLNELLHPGSCPLIIDNASKTVPSFCKYFYGVPTGSNQSGGFSVDTIIPQNIQDSASCHAKSSFFTPPLNQQDKCLYIDLDYQPEPFSNINSSGTTHISTMIARVALLSGKQYTGQVEFKTNDNSGRFDGGINSTGTNPHSTSVDNLNSTGLITYTPGKPTTGIDVFLNNAGNNLDISSPACQIALHPVITPIKKYICNTPPTIKKTGNQYCVTNPQPNQNLCWNITGINTTFNNGNTQDSGTCVTLKTTPTNKSFNLNVQDCNPNYSLICSANYHETNVPTLVKEVSKFLNGIYTKSITYSATNTNTPTNTNAPFYKIIFTPNNYLQGKWMSATITDPAFSGKIAGNMDSTNNKKSTFSGDISFNKQFTVKSQNNTYNYCNNTDLSNGNACYQINPNKKEIIINGIHSSNPITISYQGNMNSTLTLSDCQTGNYCKETFKNISKLTDMETCTKITNSKGKSQWTCIPVSIPSKPIVSNDTNVDIICPYLLTRASGDIFTEGNLKYGTDISKCYPYKNTSGLIIKPIKAISENLAKTGESHFVTINHEICSAGQNDFKKLFLNKSTNSPITPEQKATINALKKVYGADLTKLSSQICEVGLLPGTAWTKADIQKAITTNINILTRWSTPSNSTTINLTNSSVYFYDGSMRKGNVTLNGMEIKDGQGAKTIIVKNANLYIAGNITYGPGTVNKSSDIASLGVIVINGNIIIDPSVKTLSGAYIAINTKDNGRGLILSGNKNKNNGVQSDKTLTIYGSLFGDIGDLFNNRIAAGSPAKNQGSITVRYDQRIIENPPAGFSDILGSLSQSQIAR